MCSINFSRSLVFGLPMLLAAWLLLPAEAEARNPNNSLWLKNISGSAAVGSEKNEDANPQIEVVGSTVHAMWIADKPGSGGYQLRYRRSTDRGRSWEPIQVLYASDEVLTNESTYRKMAVSGNTVHIFQNASVARNDSWTMKLVYFRSLDNGASFEPARDVILPTDDLRKIYGIYATASENEVTVAYENESNIEVDDSVNILISSDNGNSFAVKQAAYFSESYKKPYYQSPAILDMQRTGDQIYIVYGAGYVYYELIWRYLFLAASSDGGNTWTRTIMSTPSKNGEHKSLAGHDDSYSPKIAIADNNVYVTWAGYDQNDEIHLFLRKSMDKGKTFAGAVNLTKGKLPSGSELNSGSETLAAKSKNLYIAYMLHNDADEIRLIRSLDAGASFKASQRLTSDPATSGSDTENGRWPWIRLDPRDATGSQLHVLWSVPTYTYSADAGKTFRSPVRLDTFTSWLAKSQMAIDENGAIHAVAMGEIGNLSNDNDIFYRKYHPVAAKSDPAGNKSLLLQQFDSNGDEIGTERYDTMQIPASPSVELTQKITIEAWVKPNRQDESSGCFVFKDHPKTHFWGRGAYLLCQSASGEVEALIGTTSDDSYYSITSERPLPNAKWSHVAMTYDSSGGDSNFKLYVNGVLAASDTATGTLISVSGDSVLIGGGDWEGYASGSNPNSITIDELRFWRRALSVAEIKSNMNKELTGLEFGLSAYYSFNEPITPYGTIRDITGRGNDGVLMYKESLTNGVVYLPVKPSSLVATSMSSSAIVLNWKENSDNETQFQVFRRINSGAWTKLTTLAKDKKSYRDATAVGNDTTKGYSYAVAACNNAGCSLRSIPVTVPFKPNGIQASAGVGKIVIRWTDNSSNESGFQIQRKQGGCSSDNAWSDLKRTGANATAYSDSGLISGNRYSYRLRAFKRSSSMPYGYGNSQWTACVSQIAK